MHCAARARSSDAAASVAIVLAAALPTDAADIDDAEPGAVREGSSLLAETKAPTARELEVISLIAQGLSHKQVAEQLGISPHTVANHVAHVRTKLNAAGAEHAVAIAIRAGLV
ncbi:MAG: helix-turn-helix transcriptional regulator [Microbacterium sp.]|uniref:response regulator transcription factor n=2 Tax=Microbacterium sp. TaxID=51671 RepID=UPI001AD54AB4|nr:helix-turn-helix transcriptional regulator [Microbacterium sp.]MBN9153654.1 helix-turn-helix transcriptional regulator [Microbacterium sp.]